MTAPPMADPSVTHDDRCPSLTLGGSARSACLCIGRSYAVRPKPTRFTWLLEPGGTGNSRRRTNAAPIVKVTSKTLLADAGVDWDTVRLWGRANGIPADHTKPLVPSLRCVTAYLAAHKPTTT